MTPLIYRALLTQTGTSAPTAVVLENTLGGEVSYTYGSPGSYIASSAGLFPAAKSFIRIVTETGANVVAKQILAPNLILISSIVNNVNVDGQLINTPFEIIVYP